EDRSDLVDGLADRMDAAARGGRRRQGQGDVDGFRLEARVESCRLEIAAPGFNETGNLGLEPVDGGTGALALFRRHGAERGKERGNAALLAEGSDAHGIERGFVAGGGNGGGKLGAEAGDLVLEGHGGLFRSCLAALEHFEQAESGENCRSTWFSTPTLDPLPSRGRASAENLGHKNKTPRAGPLKAAQGVNLTSAKLGSVRRRCARESSFRRAPDTQALPWPWRPARRTLRAG